MNISPQRRRRILRAHELRQRGHPLREIAFMLNVSAATVHADLRLLEEHWELLVGDIHDDLLLQQIARLGARVERLGQTDPVRDAMDALGPTGWLSLDQYIQIEDRHERRLAQAERELRLLLKQLRSRREVDSVRSNDYPEDELADPAPHVYPEDELNKPEHEDPPIPSQTQEIAPSAFSKTFGSDTPVPRNTGRNHPCPCGSGKKRKNCHPQPLPTH